MKPPLTFLLALTFLFLFSGFVYGDDFQDGLDAARKGDYKTAFRWTRLSAEQGLPPAQYNLGFMYFRGQGVIQDYKEAFKWYRLSAEQGDEYAQNNLGVMYDNGHGVPQDYKEAIKWYRLSAEQSARFYWFRRWHSDHIHLPVETRLSLMLHLKHFPVFLTSSFPSHL
jgi:TPR repeat protein